MEITPIAHIETGFTEKFGIPRQSGLADTAATIVFEPKYRNEQAVRGIEGFSHLWLIWQFEDTQRGEEDSWSPTVRPPILGGNQRVGVFATRSPFRPNPLGLSSVRLESVEFTDRGPLLHVRGADLRNNTPIFDIKPYVPYADIHQDATEGFARPENWQMLTVELPNELAAGLDEAVLTELIAVLELDPRPAIHHDPERIYYMAFYQFNVGFSVDDTTHTLRVLSL